MSERNTNIRAFLLLSTPSLLSGCIAVFVGIVVFVGPIILTQFGGRLQQSLLGVRSYDKSTLGSSSGIISTHFLANGFVGNAIFFLLWGFVGLVVYFIAESVVRELLGAHDLVKEFNYVHIDRGSLGRSVAERSLVRIGTVVAWGFLLRTLCYTLIPYAIAAAHISALKVYSASDWARSIGLAVSCVLAVHILAVLLRLMLLRPRLFTNEAR
jgi:hypothetical protein